MMLKLNHAAKLTKENFWDAIYKMYPAQVQHFYDWIDNYKAIVDWNNLFNAGLCNSETLGLQKIEAPKFHEIPIAMQIGIFMSYVIETENMTNKEAQQYDQFVTIKAAITIHFTEMAAEAGEFDEEQ